MFEWNVCGYAATQPACLRLMYPDNPRLHEMVQLDSDLRIWLCGADNAELAAVDLQAGGAAHWLQFTPSLHNSAVQRLEPAANCLAEHCYAPS